MSTKGEAMLTLGYIREDPSWEQEVWISFSDLISSKEAEFVTLGVGDLVLSLDPGSGLTYLGTREWTLRKVLRVSDFEETGDALNYSLDVLSILSSPEAAMYSVTREELLRAHSWFPVPEGFFKPLPRVVWRWLRDVRGVPLTGD